MMKKYDYLIVGSGFFGSTFAHLVTKHYNKKCLVIEKRNHIGGNCYTENKEGIHVHKYGPHIFHTNSLKIWQFVNQFADFNNYVNRPKVNYKNNIYSFPINLFSLYQIFGVKTPYEAKTKLESLKIKYDSPSNLEEWILNEVGSEIYEIFIKGYTTKQWGRDPKNLPSSIIKRLPIRLTFDDNHYQDRYQGIPIGGYTQIFEKMLDDIDIMLETDYLSNKDYYNSLADKVVYTGPTDAFYDYRFGKLQYRSLRFETEKLNISDYQGNAIINYTEKEIPYTRIVEHKHFDFTNCDHTYITREYPLEYNNTSDPYYPINDELNNDLYKKYDDLKNQEKNIIFGGRLTEYKYYDMHQIIAAAMKAVEKEINL